MVALLKLYATMCSLFPGGNKLEESRNENGENLHEPTSAELNAELHKAIYRNESHLNRLLDAGMATLILYGGIALLIVTFV